MRRRVYQRTGGFFGDCNQVQVGLGSEIACPLGERGVECTAGRADFSATAVIKYQ